MAPPRPHRSLRVQISRVALMLTLAVTVSITQVNAGARVLRVGDIELRACENGAYCGRLDRPLDPTGAVADRIAIYFEFYPHSGPGQSQGTLVATEGGPGYSATASRNEYLELFEPLRETRDVLIMDNRGTGGSSAIDCHGLQVGSRWTVQSVAACGQYLGLRAPLYSTTYAADDLAEILSALHVSKIDLYGDSYGTYFEQIFAVRHPSFLRSIVLDGAYPLSGTDYPWYPTYAPAMRDKFNLACARFPACAALPGDSITHIEPALEELRTRPSRARGHDIDGVKRTFRAAASQLAIVMYGSAPAFTTVRETDAAARAFVRGDRKPLLRLMAETAAAVDSRDPTADPARWSAGLAAAVMCQDPPQIYDMRLMPARRMVDRDRVLAERRRKFPDTYAPFTLDEYRAMPLDYSFLDQCVGWPVSPASHPAAQAGVNAVYPDIPALVISGELDNITTPADGAAVAAAFEHGVQIRIANSFHVNALPHAGSTCAAEIVRRFMGTMTPGDTSCAATVSPLRLVPEFAIASQNLEPVIAEAGNTADRARLQAAAAALWAIGDVLARIDYNTSGHGAGLRGGRFRIFAKADGAQITLTAVHWTRDLAINGKIFRSPGRNGVVRASVQVSGARTNGLLEISWTEGAAPVARITGTLGNAKVVARADAP